MFFSKANISLFGFSVKLTYPRFVFQSKLEVRLKNHEPIKKLLTLLKHFFRLLIHFTALKVHL